MEEIKLLTFYFVYFVALKTRSRFVYKWRIPVRNSDFSGAVVSSGRSLFSTRLDQRKRPSRLDHFGGNCTTVTSLSIIVIIIECGKPRRLENLRHLERLPK